jgi:transposase
MSDNTRRHHDNELKARTVRRHLGGKEPVSALAAELQIQPSVIHQWVNQVLAQAERAFEKPGARNMSERSKDRRIEQLEAKIVQKNEVIAELMEDNVRSKKANGEL